MRLTLAFVLAFCSIVYELLIAKTVAKLAGNAMLWESVTIGVFVLGMGIGAFGMRRPGAAPLRRLAQLELLLTLVGGASTAVLLYLHIIYRIYLYDEGYLREIFAVPPVYWFAGACQLLTLVVGALTGAELPLLLADADGAHGPQSETRVLAAYYFGTLAGTLATPALVVTQGDVIRIAVGIAGVNLAAAVALIVATRKGGPSWRWLGAAAGAAAALVAIGSGSEAFSAKHLQNFYYNRFSWVGWPDGRVESFFPVDYRNLDTFLAKYPRVTRIVSAHQQIDIVKRGPPAIEGGDPEDAREDDFSVFIDGRFQISSSSHADYHEHLAHVPVMTREAAPKRVLVLGAGDGLLVREILKYGERLESVTMVELDLEMIRLARTYEPLRSLNGGSLDDPKVTVVNRDAFRWLRTTADRFDAVYMDLTYPFDFDSARLYSAEFLGLAARVLNDGGFLALPSPIDYVEQEGARFEPLVYSTLTAAGFRRIMAFKGRSDAFLMAVKQPEVLVPGAGQPGVALAVLETDFFATGRWREVSGVFDPEAVHSLLRPKLFGVEDPFF